MTTEFPVETPPGAGDLRAGYFRLQQRCRDAIHHGEIQSALGLADEAMALALAARDPDLAHRATTTRSMVLLESGQVTAAEKGLREVVLQSADDEVQCRAAFYLASSLRRQRRIGKAQVFARTAMDKSEILGDPVWRARCHNLLGNIYLNQGAHPEAVREYQRALDLWRSLPGDHRFATAIVLDNLGYCLTLMKRAESGIPLIRQALTLAIQVADHRTEAECRQDLAHAHLNRNETDAARG
ncbi:MAG: tetratricopeptide repeat protein, partial [Acidobacteriota bacterium]